MRIVGLMATTVFPALALPACAKADDPAIAICEDVVKAQLKAPKSYERVDAAIDGNKVVITYDAVNEFNAPLRHTKVCAYVAAKDGMLTFTSAKAENALKVTESINKEIDEAKASGLTDEKRKALQKRIDDAVADAIRDAPVVFADILIAMKFEGFPIDPKTTAVKVQ